MIYAVIDRATNNVLGEFETHEEAEALRLELVERDLHAEDRVEIVGADLDREPRKPVRRVPA